MKKLFILVCIAASAIACKSKHPANKTDTASADTTGKKPAVVYETLNGIDSATAYKMMDNYTSGMATDTHPVVLNFIIPQPMLNDIVALLDDEENVPTSTGHYTDGIRIYFAKEQPNSPNITLLLVPTVDSLNKVCNHHDYYGHSSKAALFGLSSLKLTVLPKGTPGAELYQVSGAPDDNSCDFEHNPHYIFRSKAESMVRACHDHALVSNAEWFPLEIFEKMSAESRCDGARIYFVTHLAGDPTPANIGKDGFLMTTTHKDAQGVYRDYFDCDAADIALFKKIDAKVRKGGTHHMNIPGQDNGEICPSNCN